MKRAVTLVAFTAFTAPALAGSGPGFVSSFNIGTSTYASYGSTNNPIESTSDADPIPSFFGSSSSSSLLRSFDEDGFVYDTARATADLSVSGTARVWSIEGMFLASCGSMFYDTDSEGEFVFDATFSLQVGQTLTLGGLYDEEYDGGKFTQGVSEIDIAVYRDGMLIHEDSRFSSGMFERFSTIEAIGAVYRLEITGGSYAGTYDGTGGRSSFGASEFSIDVSIIPAPMTAAPLAFAGVLAAHRRRA